ncbi:MAG: mechanosensitive ion channel family protein [Solirubrobacterales bacterium]
MEPSFWQENGDWVTAAISMAVAVAIALVIDRLVIGRAARVADRVADAGISRGAQTRLRLIRRLVFLVIVLIGAAIALSQFDKLNKLAAGLLASSALLGLVLGFAAQKVLANPLAGIMLAITQPIRIGDSIEIEDVSGRVDDVTLAHTFVDTGDGRLMVVPNEKVVSSILFNRSTGDRSAPASVSVWLPPAADLARAKAALEDLELSSVDVAEITPDGVRLEVHGASDPHRTVVVGEEAALREHAHQALLSAGLLAS